MTEGCPVSPASHGMGTTGEGQHSRENLCHRCGWHPWAAPLALWVAHRWLGSDVTQPQSPRNGHGRVTALQHPFGNNPCSLPPLETSRAQPAPQGSVGEPPATRRKKYDIHPLPKYNI